MGEPKQFCSLGVSHETREKVRALAGRLSNIRKRPVSIAETIDLLLKQKGEVIEAERAKK